MAAYMMSVGLWVSGLAFCVMLSPYHQKIGNRKAGKAWLLTLAKLWAMGLLQAVLMILCLSWINGFQPEYMGKTLIIACLASIAFLTLEYCVNFFLDIIGDFILLVFMVLQLSGCAGTYPLELSDKFYQVLNPFMPFTYTVHGDFHLTCTIQDTLHSIGGSHPQIIMTVGRNDSILDTVYMIHQIFDFRPIFVRQAITGRIRDIDNCRASFDDRLYHTCQIFVVSTSGIFAIKFDVFHISLGIFGSSDSPFQNIFLIRIELIPDMIIGRSNTCMDTSVLCIFQCFGSHINIFFHRTGKRTDCRPRYGFRYFNNAIEISRTRYGETGFYHVYSQFFQSFGYLNLFNTIQLATRHLFTVTQCRVENK